MPGSAVPTGVHQRIVCEVARGIVEALNEAKVKKPLVARLIGVNQEEGQRILSEHGVSVLESMEEAVKEAVELSGG